MRIVVSTHKGVIYNDDISYFVIKNEDGEFAVLNNHIPVISIIPDGYIKIVKETNMAFYYVIINGMLEFKDNNASVLAQEAISGETIEKAKETLANVRKKRIEENKKKHMDYTAQENDLKKNIKASRAGQL